jgi:hypothetical protein
MKKLTTFFGALLLLTLMVGCHRSQADRYQRYLEEVNDSDSNFEYITPRADSVNIDEEVDADVKKGDWADDDGLVAVPDIPKERKIQRTGGNYDPMKEFAR